MPNNVEISLIVEDLLTKQYKKIHNDIIKTNKKTTKATETAAQKQAAASKKAVQGLKAQQVAAVALAGVMTGLVSKSFINAQRNVDRIMNALKVGTGTVEAATKEFQFLEQEATRLGLELQTTALSYAQLTAAAKNTNLTANEQREIFLGVSEAGAALGLSAADMEGALRAVQQMISKGNVQAEELRGQLGERIPGAFSIAAKAMGLTEKELNKQLELGNVLAENMLPKLAKELRSTFGATAAKGPETLNGKINILKNTVFEFQREVLAGGGADFLKDVFDGAAGAVEIFGKNVDLAATAGKTFLAVFAANKLIDLSNNIGKVNFKMKSLHASMALVAGAALTIDTLLKAFEAKSGQIGGKDFLTNEKDVERARVALETVRALKDEVTKLQQRGGTHASLAGLQTVGITADEQKRVNAYKDAIRVLSELMGSKFDPDRNLDALTHSMNQVEKRFEAAAQAAKTLKKEIDKVVQTPVVQTFIPGNIKPDNRQRNIMLKHRDELRKALGEDRLTEIEERKKTVEEKNELYKKDFENFHRWNQRRKDDIAETEATIKATVNAGLSGAVSVTNALGQLAAVRGENELKAAQAAGASEKKLDAIRKKSFEKQKEFSLKSAFISLAQAVLAGYSQKPFTPVGMTAGSLALLAGGIQIQAIKEQTFARGGIVEGSTTTGDHIPVRANAGEMILNQGQQKRLLSMANGGGAVGGSVIQFSAPVINIQNGDPALVKQAVDQTYQEMLHNFSLTQRDSSTHELEAF